MPPSPGVGATLLSGLANYGRIREQRHYSIAAWEVLRRYRITNGELGDQQMSVSDAALERTAAAVATIRQACVRKTDVVKGI